jgi:hypothetical protein
LHLKFTPNFKVKYSKVYQRCQALFSGSNHLCITGSSLAAATLLEFRKLNIGRNRTNDIRKTTSNIITEPITHNAVAKNFASVAHLFAVFAGAEHLYLPLLIV